MDILVFCDESCHLENDGFDILVMGAISLPSDAKNTVVQDIRRIKNKHNISSWFEIKWTKISPAKIDFYKELIKYYFNNPSINFRGLVAKNKLSLDHTKFNNVDYDLWYYKMYFLTLNNIITPINNYRIFIDIKDTKGGPRIRKLRDVLCNNIYDFKNEIIKDIQQIRSHESEIMELTDLIIGALSYTHRFNNEFSKTSPAKQEIVTLIKELSGSNLLCSTAKSSEKFNLFIWEAQK